MVALTGELGEPPDRHPRPVAARRAARHRARRRRDQPRRADDVHRDPPLGAVPRASARAGRGGRDDRRGPDPEPRHDRRQRRQRLAGRRHAAGPARRRRRRSCSARRAASGRSPAAEFWPAYRQTALAPDELLLRIRIPLPAGRELRFRKVGTRRAQSISKVVMALGWRDGSAAPAPLDGRAARARVRGGHADPCRAPPRPSSRAGRRRPRRPTARPRRWRRARSRSTTSARPPSTAGSSPRASSIG